MDGRKGPRAVVGGDEVAVAHLHPTDPCLGSPPGGLEVPPLSAPARIEIEARRGKPAPDRKPEDVCAVALVSGAKSALPGA